MYIMMIELKEAKMNYLDYTYNLKIEKGKVYAIKGDNGSGKTTLIRLLLGLIKPDCGYISSNKYQISYLPEIINFPPYIKVSRYLKGMAKLKGVNDYESLANYFKLPLNKAIHELSKGNKQKLALVITFLNEPNIICLDEPFNGLDNEMVNNLIELIKTRKANKQTFIITTHNNKYIESLVDEYIVL